MLWQEWYAVVSQFRKACARTRTFFWLVLALATMSLPHDALGVCGLMRAGRLRKHCYRGLLRLFHSSAVRLDSLSLMWIAAAFSLFRPIRIKGRPLLVADSTKRPKEGRRMPGVKMVHQDSDCNAKRPYVMAHTFQTLALLVRTATPKILAVPLITRLGDGIKFTPRDHRGLADHLADLFLKSVARIHWRTPLVVVADSFYACRNLLEPLAAAGHGVVTRLRKNGVAFFQPTGVERRRGRKRKWGRKIKLKSLFAHDADFKATSVDREGKSLQVRYLCIDLLWKPLGRLVRFVLVKYPDWPDAILMSSDVSLAPQAIIQCYVYRFRIELCFRAAIHTLHAFAYRFWLLTLRPWVWGDVTRFLHRASKDHREAVRRKVATYDLWVQLATIAQGLLHHLSVNCTAAVWRSFHGFMRTVDRGMPPTEQVAAQALWETFSEFPSIARGTRKLEKFIAHALDGGVTHWPAGPPARKPAS